MNFERGLSALKLCMRLLRGWGMFEGDFADMCAENGRASDCVKHAQTSEARIHIGGGGNLFL